MDPTTFQEPSQLVWATETHPLMPTTGPAPLPHRPKGRNGRPGALDIPLMEFGKAKKLRKKLTELATEDLGLLGKKMTGDVFQAFVKAITSTLKCSVAVASSTLSSFVGQVLTWEKLDWICQFVAVNMDLLLAEKSVTPTSYGVPVGWTCLKVERVETVVNSHIAMLHCSIQWGPHFGRAVLREVSDRAPEAEGLMRYTGLINRTRPYAVLSMLKDLFLLAEVVQGRVRNKDCLTFRRMDKNNYLLGRNRETIQEHFDAQYATRLKQQSEGGNSHVSDQVGQ